MHHQDQNHNIAATYRLHKHGYLRNLQILVILHCKLKNKSGPKAEPCGTPNVILRTVSWLSGANKKSLLNFYRNYTKIMLNLEVSEGRYWSQKNPRVSHLQPNKIKILSYYVVYEDLQTLQICTIVNEFCNSFISSSIQLRYYG